MLNLSSWTLRYKLILRSLWDFYTKKMKVSVAAFVSLILLQAACTKMSSFGSESVAPADLPNSGGAASGVLAGGGANATSSEQSSSTQTSSSPSLPDSASTPLTINGSLGQIAPNGIIYGWATANAPDYGQAYGNYVDINVVVDNLSTYIGGTTANEALLNNIPAGFSYDLFSNLPVSLRDGKVHTVFVAAGYKGQNWIVLPGTLSFTAPTPPQPQGLFTVSGTNVIYYSDGLSSYCSYRDPDQYVYSTGNVDASGNPSYSSVITISSLPQMTNAGFCQWNSVIGSGNFVPYSTPNSEVVLCEDNVLYGTTASSHLIYRTEGDSSGIHRNSSSTLGSGAINFQKSATTYSSYVHPAQYQKGILKVQYELQSASGYVGLKVLHNGFTLQNGTAYPYPGISIRLYSDVAVISSDTNRWVGGQVIAVAPITSVPNTPSEVAISFDITTGILGIRQITPVDSRGTFQVQLPASSLQQTQPAGIGLFSNGSSFQVKRVRVSWEDSRRLLMYGQDDDNLFDISGNLVGHLPPVQLSSAYDYTTIGVDIAHFRSLIVYGNHGFLGAPNALAQFEGTQGYAVRDLLSGQLVANFTDLSVFSCIPTAGNNGNSFDGFQLINEATTPSNQSDGLIFGSVGPRLCWVNWRAFDAGLASGDFSQFITPQVFSNGQQSKFTAGGAQLGFADAMNSLDGSLSRAEICNVSNPTGFQTQTTFIHHPTIAPFFDINEIDLPLAPAPETEAGAGGVVMAVRDRDGGFIERWANGFHVQNLMLNLFNLPGSTPIIIPLSALMNSAPSAAPYLASANDMQSLESPGSIFVQQYSWTPSSGSASLIGQGWNSLNIGARQDAIPFKSSIPNIIYDAYELLVPWNYQTNSLAAP